jgi:hypothetical protein
LAWKRSAYCDFAERTRASCAARVAEPSHSLSANFCLRLSAFAARSGDARVVAGSNIAADGANAESERVREGDARRRFLARNVRRLRQTNKRLFVRIGISR